MSDGHRPQAPRQAPEPRLSRAC